MAMAMGFPETSVCISSARSIGQATLIEAFRLCIAAGYLQQVRELIDGAEHWQV
jgi:hypothetical protein